MESERRALSPAAKSVLAGSMAGMASVVVCHPFDTIRTRLQISPARFHGFFDCARQTIQKETAMGLYKGFLPPFFSQAVYKSVIFTTSSKIRNDLLPCATLLQPYLTPMAVPLISGAIAGGLNAFLVTPVELVRNRLQVQYESQRASRSYRGAYDCIRQVVQREGGLALWRGLPTTVVRDSLGVACYFLGYEFARARLARVDSMNDTAVLLTAGAFGGVSFWAIALPFDTIKSLIQVDGTKGQYIGLVSSTTRLVREHGVSHLFRGWQAAFSRGIPSAAITFWAFDRTSTYLDELDASQ
uniref:Mitochondrial carrier protein n=1 Tax=Globisporangium ultimum (strain ATCC 200006 / CBS 805.95 / DAOM BR144) TaxID=431595 RepID=K3XCD0_GLOUD